MGINYTKAKGSGAVISCQRCLKFTLLEIFTITKTREEGLLIGNKLKKLYMWNEMISLLFRDLLIWDFLKVYLFFLLII